MKLLLYEDFETNPLRVMQDIFRFIGVDDKLVPDMSYRANPGGIPKSEFWQSVVMRPNTASKFFGQSPANGDKAAAQGCALARKHRSRGDPAGGAATLARRIAR